MSCIFSIFFGTNAERKPKIHPSPVIRCNFIVQSRYDFVHATFTE